MSNVSYGTVLAQAHALPREDRWRLVNDVLEDLRQNEDKASITEFFGALGPVREDINERVCRLRADWD